VAGAVLARAYSQVQLANPDFVKLAEAFGARPAASPARTRSRTPSGKLLAHTDGPILLECRVAKEDNVYPMIPAGQSVEEMLDTPEPGPPNPAPARNLNNSSSCTRAALQEPHQRSRAMTQSPPPPSRRSSPPPAEREKRHTISLLVENKFGAFTRITGLFAAKGYNIDSLSVGRPKTNRSRA